MIFKAMQAPKEENVNQLQLYLHYFRIPKGILLYVNKDTQELKEFVVEYEEKKARSLLAELENLKKNIDLNTVPARIASYPTDWQCRYCPFREVCDAGEPGEMSWEDLKMKIESEGSANN